MEIGEKIKRLRLQRGLTQEELADRCELSKGFISLLERDLTSPSIATLGDVLECLGTDLAAFFTEHAEEKLVFSEEDTYIKEDGEVLKGTIRWLVPTAQKNEMEPILVEMAAGGETDWDKPHEGEEFGYVLAGAVQIELGDRIVKARKGESFYYKTTEPHRLLNPGKAPCRLLWISTPPSF
ncbi:MAG: cupin domain-containing protein [Clostridia bacterium]|nr:cupin domain-containing protein [Clostridia bacterium]